MTSPKTPIPSPADIDRLLSLATMRDSLDGLADRFLTTTNVVASSLMAASALQEQTGYTDFSVPYTKPEDYWLPISSQRYQSLDKESRRTRAFLKRIYEAPNANMHFGFASTVWIDAYYPQSNCLLIHKQSDLDQLLESLKSFGIPTTDFEALIPNDTKESGGNMWLSVQERLKSLGLSVHQTRLPLSQTKFFPENRIGLMLRPSDSHSLGYQRTLNRILFILSVWLKLPLMLPGSEMNAQHPTVRERF